MGNSKRWREFITWWNKAIKTAEHTHPADKCIICRANKKIDEIKRNIDKEE